MSEVQARRLREGAHTRRSVMLMAGGLLAFPGPVPVRAADTVGDWRRRTGIYRFGLVAPSGYPSRDALDGFARHAAGRLAMPVEALVFRDAPSLVDALISGRLEQAALPALAYGAGEARCQCLVPLAAPVASNGATGLRSVLAVNHDEVKVFADLAGKTVGYGPPGSLTGDIIPAFAFRFLGNRLAASGLSLKAAASFEEAAGRFARGEVAAMFAWEYEGGLVPEAREQSLAGRITAGAGGPPVSALWRSDVVPFGPHCVRADMPAAVRALVAGMMIAMAQEAPDAFDAVSPSLGGGMRAVTAADYAFTLALARDLGTRRSQDRPELP